MWGGHLRPCVGVWGGLLLPCVGAWGTLLIRCASLHPPICPLPCWPQWWDRSSLVVKLCVVVAFLFSLHIITPVLGIKPYKGTRSCLKKYDDYISADTVVRPCPGIVGDAGHPLGAHVHPYELHGLRCIPALPVWVSSASRPPPSAPRAFASRACCVRCSPAPCLPRDCPMIAGPSPRFCSSARKHPARPHRSISLQPHGLPVAFALVPFAAHYGARPPPSEPAPAQAGDGTANFGCVFV